jgi:hypothetical protein
METRADPTFPSDKTFERLGSKAEFLKKVLEHCRSRPGYEDVIGLCEAYHLRSGAPDNPIS